MFLHFPKNLSTQRKLKFKQQLAGKSTKIKNRLLNFNLFWVFLKVRIKISILTIFWYINNFLSSLSQVEFSVENLLETSQRKFLLRDYYSSQPRISKRILEENFSRETLIVLIRENLENSHRKFLLNIPKSSHLRNSIDIYNRKG